MICGYNKDESDEHIIPKSLGNDTLRTNLVCKSCNSNLGKFVDAPFINRFEVELLRSILGISGHKGSIPTPLKTGEDKEGNTIFLDAKLNPRYLSKIQDNENGYTIIANSKEEAKEMGIKKLKRNKLPDKEIEMFKDKVDDSEIQQTNEVIVKTEINLDYSDLNLEILKIAYEYFYSVVGEKYYYDDTAKKIRSKLKKAIKGENVTVDGLVGDISDSLANMAKNFNMDCHLIQIVKNQKNEMFAAVFLFNGTFSKMVLLSKTADKYQIDMDNSTELIKIETQITKDSNQK